MDIKRIETGIDTLELSMTKLKYSQVQKVNNHLPGRYSLSSHNDGLDRSYASHTFQDRGFGAIRTWQSAEHSNSVHLQLHPCSVLAEKRKPIKLFCPNSGDGDRLLDAAMEVLQAIRLKDLHDSRITRDRLTVSELDVTMNVWFDGTVDMEPLLYLFNHSRVAKRLQRRKGLGYFCVGNGQVTIKAYDKGRELSNKGVFPKKLEGKTILRIEVSMKREKYLDALGLDRDADLDAILEAGGAHAGEVILDYLNKLFPCSGDHLRYDEARGQVKTKVKKDKLRNRMFYLLEKTAITDGLDRAIEKAKDEFSLSDSQIDRLLREFDSIGVNPITLPNKSVVERLPALLVWLNRNSLDF